MMRYLPHLVALALLLSAGTLFGLWSGRWELAQPDFADAAQRLESIATTFGDWDSQDLRTLDQRESEVSGVAAYLGRRYVNRRNTQAVTVLVFCGRPGPLCTHTPDLCFPGAGLRMVGAVHRESPTGDVPAGQAEFWTGEFEREGASMAPHVRVYWSFSATGTWSAPDRPRLSFGRHPMLYKMYLSYDIPHTAHSDQEEKSVSEFVQQIIPEVQRAIARRAND